MLDCDSAILFFASVIGLVVVRRSLIFTVSIHAHASKPLLLQRCAHHGWILRRHSGDWHMPSMPGGHGHTPVAHLLGQGYGWQGCRGSGTWTCTSDPITRGHIFVDVFTVRWLQGPFMPKKSPRLLPFNIAWKKSIWESFGGKEKASAFHANNKKAAALPSKKVPWRGKGRPFSLLSEWRDRGTKRRK